MADRLDRNPPAKSARVGRLLRKLDDSLENGDVYEAHQLYRTIFFRYTSSLQYEDAAQLAFSGASRFLSQESVTSASSGQELACMFMEAHSEGHLPVNTGSLEQIRKLLKLLGSKGDGREPFVRLAVDWSKSCGGSNTKFGDPRLHRVVASVCWQFRDFVSAQWHYLHADSAEECAAMLVEVSTSGQSKGLDILITHSVLHLLVLQKDQQARMLFENFVVAHPDVSTRHPPFLMPLLNFLWFLLIASEQKLVNAFKVLRDKYSPSLQREPSYDQCLDRIAEKVFGLQSASGGGGMEELLRKFTSSLSTTGGGTSAPLEDEDVD